MVDHFILEVGETWIKVDKSLCRKLQQGLNDVIVSAKMVGYEIEYREVGSPVPGGGVKAKVAFKYQGIVNYGLTFGANGDHYLRSVEFHDVDNPTNNERAGLKEDILDPIRVLMEILAEDKNGLEAM